MRESRLAPLSGILVTVLLAAAAAVIGNYDFMSPGDEIAAFYADDPRRVMVGAFLGLLAAPFLVWFTGSLYSALSEGSERVDRLGVLAVAGGVSAAALISIGFLAHYAGAERVLIRGEIDPGGAAVLFDVASLASSSGGGMGLAVMVGAVAVGASRAGLPRWLGWTSGIVAVGLLSPINYLVVGLVLVWTPTVGVLLYRSGSGRATGLEASPAAGVAG